MEKNRGRIHTLGGAIEHVKNGGAGVDTIKKIIGLGKRQGVGIKTWGAIDYLVRVHNYVVIREP